MIKEQLGDSVGPSQASGLLVLWCSQNPYKLGWPREAPSQPVAEQLQLLCSYLPSSATALGSKALDASFKPLLVGFIIISPLPNLNVSL